VGICRINPVFGRFLPGRAKDLSALLYVHRTTYDYLCDNCIDGWQTPQHSPFCTATVLKHVTHWSNGDLGGAGQCRYLLIRQETQPGATLKNIYRGFTFVPTFVLVRKMWHMLTTSLRHVYVAYSSRPAKQVMTSTGWCKNIFGMLSTWQRAQSALKIPPNLQITLIYSVYRNDVFLIDLNGQNTGLVHCQFTASQYSVCQNVVKRALFFNSYDILWWLGNDIRPLK